MRTSVETIITIVSRISNKYSRMSILLDDESTVIKLTT
jgi:hypothetical protein